MIAIQSRPATAGFTLIELMLVVAIVGVLAALAAPAMRQLILTQYVRAGATDLQTALFFARSEAVKRAGCVSVIPTSSAWQNGWSVKAESAPGACDGGGATLRSQSALSDQLSSMSGSTIIYQSNGRLQNSTTPTITFKTSMTTIPARCVVVDLSGRPSVVYAGDSTSDSCS
jgi:type IV fimbrial biogenesis protein FimT